MKMNMVSAWDLLCGKTICDEMELHLIATAPKFRRQGVASALLAQMFQAARHQQISRIFVRSSCQ